MKKFAAVLLLCPLSAFAQETLVTDAADAMPEQTWADKHHGGFGRWLDKSANRIDDWFGKQDPNKPAQASLRVMLDSSWNELDGTTVKPRVRGKLKLPTLQNRWSVLIGDEMLDEEKSGGGIHNDRRVASKGEKTLDRKKAREDNGSLALRFSQFRKQMGLDVDLGVRRDDIFVRVKGDKSWQLSENIEARFEQSYRYGSRSEHTALSTLDFTRAYAPDQRLVNHTQLLYTHKDGAEATAWGNSLYAQRDWAGDLGTKTLSVGLYAGGEFEHKSPQLNTYGPYISYRQPVWRDWLFLQGDASFYNDKAADRDHYLSLFSRIEMVF